MTFGTTMAEKNIQLQEKVGEHLVNKHFDVVLKLTSVKRLAELQKEDELFFQFNSIKSLSNRFLSHLSVQPLDPSAKTILLQFNGYHPDFCRDMLNGLIQTFFEFDLKLKRKGSDNVLVFIDQQLDSLSAELKFSKDNLLNFQRESNVGNLEQDIDFTSEIEKLQIEMIEINLEKRTLANVMDKINNDPQRLEIYRLLPEMLGKSYENSLSGLFVELQALLERKEDISFQVTPENSVYQALEKRIITKIDIIRKK